MEIAQGRYRLLRKIGEGGAGVVYGAVDALLGRSVAIKALHSSFDSSILLYEAQVLASLDHPGVVTLFDLIEEDGHSYIVMEMVDGCDLSQWLAHHDGLGLSVVAHLFRRIASIVSDAHRAGVLHCDLKPSNILISSHGEVKLSDFTIARSRHLVPPAERSEGTNGYSAPEIRRGGEVDVRADVFSLGVILNELTSRAATGTSVPAAFSAVIAQATSPEVEGRFDTVDAMMDALPGEHEAVTRISGRSIASDLTRIIPRPSFSGTRSRRRPATALTVALSCAAFISALVFTHFSATASPAHVRVPKFVGRQNTMDMTIARSLQLRYRSRYAYSSAFAKGIVMAQSPSASSSLVTGGTVNVVISKGPAPISLPDVTRMQSALAVAELQEEGFHVQTQTHDSLGDPAHTVLAQVPAGHTMQLPGTTVTLTVSTKPWWDVLGW